jgi:hypothetical protein
MNLTENNIVTYRVVYAGNVLLETASKPVADQFVAGLNKDVQEQVRIVPVTDAGLQVLLG